MSSPLPEADFWSESTRSSRRAAYRHTSGPHRSVVIAAAVAAVVAGVVMVLVVRYLVGGGDRVTQASTLSIPATGLPGGASPAAATPSLQPSDSHSPTGVPSPTGSASRTTGSSKVVAQRTTSTAKTVAAKAKPKPTTATTTKAAAAKPATTTTTSAAAAGSGSTWAKQVLDLTNAERAAAGCKALAWNSTLATAAQKHSDDMRDHNYFSHTGLDGRSPFERIAAEGYGYRMAAENIAAGQSSPQAVMDAWMNSSGHRANILNCGLTQLGVGVAKGGSYGVYWTQDFGTP